MDDFPLYKPSRKKKKKRRKKRRRNVVKIDDGADDMYSITFENSLKKESLLEKRGESKKPKKKKGHRKSESSIWNAIDNELLTEEQPGHSEALPTSLPVFPSSTDDDVTGPSSLPLGFPDQDEMNSGFPQDDESDPFNESNRNLPTENAFDAPNEDPAPLSFPDVPSVLNNIESPPEVNHLNNYGLTGTDSPPSPIDGEDSMEIEKGDDVEELFLTESRIEGSLSIEKTEPKNEETESSESPQEPTPPPKKEKEETPEEHSPDIIIEDEARYEPSVVEEEVSQAVIITTPEKTSKHLDMSTNDSFHASMLLETPEKNLSAIKSSQIKKSGDNIIITSDHLNLKKTTNKEVKKPSFETHPDFSDEEPDESLFKNIFPVYEQQEKEKEEKRRSLERKKEEKFDVDSMPLPLQPPSSNDPINTPTVTVSSTKIGMDVLSSNNDPQTTRQATNSILPDINVSHHQMFLEDEDLSQEEEFLRMQSLPVGRVIKFYQTRILKLQTSKTKEVEGLREWYMNILDKRLNEYKTKQLEFENIVSELRLEIKQYSLEKDRSSDFTKRLEKEKNKVEREMDMLRHNFGEKVSQSVSEKLESERRRFEEEKIQLHDEIDGYQMEINSMSKMINNLSQNGTIGSPAHQFEKHRKNSGIIFSDSEQEDDDDEEDGVMMGSIQRNKSGNENTVSSTFSKMEEYTKLKKDNALLSSKIEELERNIVLTKQETDHVFGEKDEMIKRLEDRNMRLLKQYYHHALLSVKLQLQMNFDINDMVDKAIRENIKETELNHWISNKLLSRQKQVKSKSSSKPPPKRGGGMGKKRRQSESDKKRGRRRRKRY